MELRECLVWSGVEKVEPSKGAIAGLTHRCLAHLNFNYPSRNRLTLIQRARLESQRAALTLSLRQSPFEYLEVIKAGLASQGKRIMATSSFRNSFSGAYGVKY